MMRASIAGRFRFVERDTRLRRDAMLCELRAGLSGAQKRLPCCLFYDREGSRLFEEICRLPEYYLTRAEREILEVHAPELPARLASPALLVELGSGNSEKTRLVLDAFLAAQSELEYVPVDICSEILRETAAALLADHDRLRLTAVAAEYQDGLEAVGAATGPARLVLWLGSNVGNFDRPDAVSFLRAVRATLRPGDRLLMGVDRRKSPAVLVAAYDDAAGVTADFNLNMLTRMNREFGARFEVSGFRHRVRYLEEPGRIEMHLVATRAQRVPIPGLGLQIEIGEGEWIHTENSYKYADAEIEALLAGAGLEREAWWTDSGERFRLVLARPGTST